MSTVYHVDFLKKALIKTETIETEIDFETLVHRLLDISKRVELCDPDKDQDVLWSLYEEFQREKEISRKLFESEEYLK